MALYLVGNYASPTTAAPVPVATGTAIKTLLQVKPGTTQRLRVVEWGISFDGFAAAAPGVVSLIETDVAATVTAHAAAGIQKLDSDALGMGDPTTAIFAVGTSGTGFTASAEGSTTASRVFDSQLIAPTNQYVKQFPLGREPVIEVSKFCRIRVTFGASINALCYMVLAT